ncbi:MAG: hypothetical protein U0V70_21860 [Terriglobia bacterium]
MGKTLAFGVHWSGGIFIFEGRRGKLAFRAPRLWESFLAAEVLQHRIFVLLIVLFAVFEWGVQTGRLRSRQAAYVFPLFARWEVYSSRAQGTYLSEISKRSYWQR